MFSSHRQERNEENIFAYDIARSAPRRMRELTIHMPNGGKVQVKCRAGAICENVLHLLREQGVQLPTEKPSVLRTPPPDKVNPALHEQYLEKAIRAISPIAPPTRELMQNLPNISQESMALLSRMRSAIPLSEPVGTRVTELWLVLRG